MQLPTYSLHHVAVAPQTSPLGPPATPPQELIRRRVWGGGEISQTVGQGQWTGPLLPGKPLVWECGRSMEERPILPAIPPSLGPGTGGWTGD